MPANSVPGGDSVPDFKMAVFLLHPHVAFPWCVLVGRGRLMGKGEGKERVEGGRKKKEGKEKRERKMEEEAAGEGREEADRQSSPVSSSSSKGSS